jgi:hypothetical protein
MAELDVESIGKITTTTLNVTSTGATTLYTVPTGFRFTPFCEDIECGSAASTTAVVSSGQVGALTDFLGNQTLTNLAAQYDVVTLMPIPNATPVKKKSYAAGTVFQINVVTADADGMTDGKVYLWGSIRAV